MSSLFYSKGEKTKTWTSVGLWEHFLLRTGVESSVVWWREGEWIRAQLLEWCESVCVCVISREHGDLSHVSILSMFTAPHTCKLVCTTVHWEGDYCLQCLMEWYPIVFFKLAVSYSIIFCVEILCVCIRIFVYIYYCHDSWIFSSHYAIFAAENFAITGIIYILK